jgi:hypothetical protein
MAVGLSLGATALGLSLAWNSWGCIPKLGGWAPDSETVEALREAQPGTLVTLFDWGEYALWHLGPSFKVSIDGRRETVYSDSRLDQSSAIAQGLPSGFAALAEWRPAYVWLPARSVATKGWLAGHGYRLDRDGDTSFLAVRTDLPKVKAQVPSSAADCFPR